MTLVGFDTSTPATSACVLRGDDAFEVTPAPERLLEPPGHSRELLPAVAEAMRRAEISWQDVDAVAVGVGPGTFTGLRIGIATARALAAARGLKVHPVSSLAALAAGIGAAVALPLIDARRGEVFGALHEGEREVVGPFVARPERVAEIIGEQVEMALSAGDGSLRFREILEASGVSVAAVGSELHVVRALHVCRLASGVPAVAPEGVLPTYLREPDAQPIQ